MDRRNHLLLPFFLSVAIAGALIGLILGSAGPVVRLAASVVAVMLAYLVFFESARD